MPASPFPKKKKKDVFTPLATQSTRQTNDERGEVQPEIQGHSQTSQGSGLETAMRACLAHPSFQI